MLVSLNMQNGTIAQNYKVTQGKTVVGIYNKSKLIKRIKEMYSNHPAAIHVIDNTPFEQLIKDVAKDGIYKVSVA